jgi:hypothetical protein
MKQEINATQPALSPSLEKVRDRFETWRRRKKPGSRIPEALWHRFCHQSAHWSWKRQTEPR